MARSPFVQVDRTALLMAVIALAILALQSPVHNDTWWHLAYGREMATAGGFAQVDQFSHTAAGQPFPNHQWLGERVLFTLMALGGLPLLTAASGTMIVAAWIFCWRLGGGDTLDRLFITAGAVAGSTLIWSVRPQVFTILLLPAVTLLVVRRRLFWVPPLILLWANLHGGVLLGLVVLATAAAVAVLGDRSLLREQALCLTASAAATLVTPLGARYWPEILASLQRSHFNQIQEWRPTPLAPEHFLFWLYAAAIVWLGLTRWRRIGSSQGRVLVAAALLLIIPGARTLRNVAPFLMLAAPALSHLVASPGRQKATIPAWAHRVLITGGSLVGFLLVWLAWSGPAQRLGWRPISRQAAGAIATCRGPIYNSYEGGGPIIWFVPEQRVFVDSRQDPFPTRLIEAATSVEGGGEYRALFAEHGVNCAALPPQSPAATRLRQDGWVERFRDAQWVVLERPGASAATRPSPAP